MGRNFLPAGLGGCARTRAARAYSAFSNMLLKEQVALSRCYPGYARSNLACGASRKRRRPAAKMKLRACSGHAAKGFLPFGWHPVGLSPSPIGRGRRATWRPLQPADVTCIRRGTNVASTAANSMCNAVAGNFASPVPRLSHRRRNSAQACRRRGKLFRR